MKKYLIPLFLLLSINIYAADKKEYYSIIEKTFQNKTYSDGIKSLEKAIKEYPDEANFHSNLIFMYCHSKRFSDAVNHGNSVIDKFPDSSYIKESYRWGLTALGWEEFNSKDFNKALKTFKSAYDRFPEEKDVINGYGCALREIKKYSDAISILEKGYRKFPEDAFIKENLAWSYFYLSDEMMRKGDSAKGENLLKKFFELGDKKNSDLWSGYLYKCSNLKLYEQGLELLNEAQKKFPGNNEIFKAGYWLYWNRADDRKKSGDYEDMISDLKELCRYSSSNDIIHESGMSYHHLALSNSYIHIYGAIDAICPYWKKFSGDEKKKSSALLELLKINTPLQMEFIVHNLAGMILYRDNQVDAAYIELEAGYEAALKLPFAEKFLYNKPVYISVPHKGFIDSSNVESRRYITHMGLNKNCYDFSGADENGNQVKEGVDPYKSKTGDWYGFGISVYSPADGIVLESENINSDDPPYPKTMKKGNYIQLKIEDGSIYNFYHLKKGSVKVKKGDKVKQGDIIAQLGNSASTSPHLHFGLYSADWIVSRPVFFINYTSITGGEKTFKKSGKPGIANDTSELIEVK